MKTKQPSVYIETSIVSYLTSHDSSSLLGAARQLVTRRWWARRSEYRVFISDVVLRECRAGDPVAAARRLEALREFPSLSVTARIVDIVESLVIQRIIPEKAVEDAFHISVATVHGIDLLLTWNFKHIANPVIQADISDYLAGVGLSLPFICTPEELLGEDDA